MALYRPIPFVHHLLQKHLHDQSFVIDATIGLGNDTQYIAKLLSRGGKLFGFDIQKQALLQTTTKLNNTPTNCQWRLFNQSHALMLPTLSSYVGNIDCVLFNLGYLPGENQTITTTIETTYIAILQSLTLLRPKGLLIIVTYPGHPAGHTEYDQLKKLFAKAKSSQYFITVYQQVNNNTLPPSVFLIEKRHIMR